MDRQSPQSPRTMSERGDNLVSPPRLNSPTLFMSRVTCVSCRRNPKVDESLHNRLARKKRKLLMRATRHGAAVRFMLRCFNGHLWQTEVPAFEQVSEIRDMTCPRCRG